MRNRNLLPLVMAAFLIGCGEQVTRDSEAKILAIGDSLSAWHKSSNNAISDVLERELHEEIIDRSVIGARFLYDLPLSGSMGLNISKQYRPGDWEWVIMNGGGNDLWFGCGCAACDEIIDDLISEDGVSGSIPSLVSKIRRTDAKVIYVGYLHSPGVFSLIDHCKDEDIEFEQRVAALAERTRGFYYLNLSGVVGDGDRSYHAADRIHPSLRGSREIARMLAELIRNERS